MGEFLMSVLTGGDPEGANQVADQEGEEPKQVFMPRAIRWQPRRGGHPSDRRL